MQDILRPLCTSASLVALLAAPAIAATPADVAATYAGIAHANYADSLATAHTLDAALEAFLASPSAATHEQAKEAWLAARVPYQQTEVFRFGNPIVDEWEGRVNAWPLDEGLIDYVETGLYGTSSDENPFYAVNIIANPVLNVGGETIDASAIDASLLGAMHEIEEVEANVSRGYHAIEFLLWGQDLNGTGPGAGDRPWTDFALGADCTGGNCDRRRDYLAAASDLLITDLEEITASWADGGAARSDLTSGGADGGVARIITGLGSLSYGELAGERMKLGLMLHDPEEEHDCFADNTHNSHFYNIVGMHNVYFGRYERADGNMVEGASLSDLVRASDPALDEAMRADLDTTLAAFTAIKTAADEGHMAYDQMLGEGNAEGNAMLQAAIDALVAQTQTLERIVAALDLGQLAFEGSDSLDNPEAVFQ
ncbi:MAG: imelysin family protein [Pseudomonadota bacterium]